MKVINEKAEFAVRLLKQYAKEQQTLVRGTDDLSPLETWLILRVYQMDKLTQRVDKFFEEEYKP